MANINQVIISGRIVSEQPDVNESGKVLKQTIATNLWNGKEEVGHFFTFKVLGEKMVNAMKDKLVKGAAVTINGTLNQDRWEDKDGNKRSNVSIVTNTIEITKFADAPRVTQASEPINTNEIPF